MQAERLPAECHKGLVHSSLPHVLRGPTSASVSRPSGMTGCATLLQHADLPLYPTPLALLSSRQQSMWLTPKNVLPVRTMNDSTAHAAGLDLNIASMPRSSMRPARICAGQGRRARRVSAAGGRQPATQQAALAFAATCCTCPCSACLPACLPANAACFQMLRRKCGLRWQCDAAKPALAEEAQTWYRRLEEEAM